jgi:hypothetical protein
MKKKRVGSDKFYVPSNCILVPAIFTIKSNHKKDDFSVDDRIMPLFPPQLDKNFV